jgi:hypothetical protein
MSSRAVCADLPSFKSSAALDLDQPQLSARCLIIQALAVARLFLLPKCLPLQ